MAGQTGFSTVDSCMKFLYLSCESYLHTQGHVYMCPYSDFATVPCFSISFWKLLREVLKHGSVAAHTVLYAGRTVIFSHYFTIAAHCNEGARCYGKIAAGHVQTHVVATSPQCHVQTHPDSANCCSAPLKGSRGTSGSRGALVENQFQNLEPKHCRIPLANCSVGLQDHQQHPL